MKKQVRKDKTRRIFQKRFEIKKVQSTVFRESSSLQRFLESSRFLRTTPDLWSFSAFPGVSGVKSVSVERSSKGKNCRVKRNALALSFFPMLFSSFLSLRDKNEVEFPKRLEVRGAIMESGLSLCSQVVSSSFLLDSSSFLSRSDNELRSNRANQVAGNIWSLPRLSFAQKRGIKIFSVSRYLSSLILLDLGSLGFFAQKSGRVSDVISKESQSRRVDVLNDGLFSEKSNEMPRRGNLVSSLFFFRFHRELLSSVPRNSFAVRARNRCIETGRSRSVMKFCKLSRIVLRDFASRGLLPGIKKASW